MHKNEFELQIKMHRHVWWLLLALGCISLILWVGPSKAKDSVGLRYAVGSPQVLNTGSNSVTSGAWVQLVTAANLPYACSGVVVTNAGAQPLRLGRGGTGVEVETGILIPPGANNLQVTEEIPKATRLTVKSAGDTQSSGWVTFSCYQ